MKKSRILKFLVIAIALCLTSKVKAYYNGGGGFTVSGGYGGGACTSSSRMCYNNDYFFIQARLYYVDNTGNKFEWSDPFDAKGTCNGTYFFASGKSYQFLKGKINSDCLWYNMEGQTGSYNDSTVTWNDSLTKDGARYAKASAILRHYFGDDVNKCEGKVCTPNDNLKKFLNWATAGVSDTSDTYASIMTKDSEVANTSAKKVSDGAKKGYRVIIEPALIYNSPERIIATPKQVANKSWASYINSGSRKLTGTTDAQIQYLYTDFSDVGIDYGSHSWCSNPSRTVSDLADWKIGCGMNIIDVGKYVKSNICYKRSVSGGLTCVNYDKNNESDSFKETYTKKENCTDTEIENNKNNTEYGKKISENSNCTLYCSESAFASFPGGISKGNLLGYNITPNAYFAWPARYGTNNGMKMYMSSTYKCRIVQKSGKTCSSTDINALVDNAESSIKKLKIGAKLTAGNNREINAEELVIGDTKTTKSNTSGLSISGGKTGEFSVTKTTYLEIKTNVNRYYNKSTGAVSDDSSSWIGTSVFDRGEGVVSLSEKKTEVGKEYPLTITDVQLGTGNQYGKRIGTYTCKYTVDKSGCECPAGTLREGYDLEGALASGKTCAEVQREYCDAKCVCPDDSSLEEIGKDITDEITGEPTSEACRKEQERLCYHKTCKKKDGTEVDILSCVQQKMAQGRTLGEATNICSKEICPDTEPRCELIDKTTWDKCLSDGYSWSTCYRNYCGPDFCPPGQCKYTCVTSSGVEKDISQCISDRISKNKEVFKDARAHCNATYCPSDTDTCENGKCPPEGNNCVGTCKWSKVKKGNTVTYVKTCNGKVCEQYPIFCPDRQCIKSNNVVYRTIDLNNPFPGNGKGVTTQFSNNGVKGRLPSTNWYDTVTVKDKILNARGVKGEKLYTEKTPLYEIKLTPAKIKEIRSYNKDKDYSDFKLICKSANNNAACISDFVHNNLKDAIIEKSSVYACRILNSKGSGEAEFKNCYYKDN